MLLITIYNVKYGTSTFTGLLKEVVMFINVQHNTQTIGRNFLGIVSYQRSKYTVHVWVSIKLCQLETSFKIY